MLWARTEHHYRCAQGQWPWVYWLREGVTKAGRQAKVTGQHTQVPMSTSVTDGGGEWSDSCSLQCILGPILEVGESCPDALVGQQTGIRGSRGGRMHTGPGLFSPFLWEWRRKAVWKHLEPPGLHAGLLSVVEAAHLQKDLELWWVKQGFCLTRSAWLLFLEDKKCLGGEQKETFSVSAGWGLKVIYLIWRFRELGSLFECQLGFWVLQALTSFDFYSLQGGRQGCHQAYFPDGGEEVPRVWMTVPQMARPARLEPKPIDSRRDACFLLNSFALWEAKTPSC